MNIYIKLFIVFLFIFKFSIIFSQNNDTLNYENLLNLSLKDLMNMKISVTGKSDLSIRESPGIVSVLTEQDIKNSGARDLIDLLRLIPGISFGSEWDNIIGIGIRGNNATEGKFLLLIDNQQMNETNFGSFPFGLHIDPSSIKRIEIIRGPGSVIYGGSAELAVINIITKNGGDINGLKLSFDNAFSNKDFSRNGINFQYGTKYNDNTNFSLKAYYNRGNRSNSTYISLDTTLIDYLNNSKIESANVNMKFNYRNFSLIGIFDNYLSQNTEGFGYILNRGYFVGADYLLNLTNNINIHPQVNFKNQLPWYFINFESKEFYNTSNNKYSLYFPILYKSQYLSLLFGAESIIETAEKQKENIVFNSNNLPKVQYLNNAVFSEISIKTKLVNLNFGTRYNNHNVFGSSFVPRISISKIYNDFHFKAIYNQAFKSPTIANIDYNINIKPETTEIIEFESGYQILEDMNIVLNLFHILIKDPILYIPNPITGADYYKNFEKTGSYGFEIIYKLRQNWGVLATNIAYYHQANNSIQEYNIENYPSTYGAFPTYNASVYSSINISKRITFNYDIKFFGKRFTYVHSDKNWSNYNLVTYNRTYLLNVFLKCTDFLTDGFDASIGVYNATNRDYFFINSYKGLQNPIPSQGREIALKLSYFIPLKSDNK